MSTTSRGYGAKHQEIRRELAPLVESGLAVCARCGQPIAADAAWDLGHDDDDRTRYVGPEHAACNRATAGRRAARARMPREGAPGLTAGPDPLPPTTTR